MEFSYKTATQPSQRQIQNWFDSTYKTKGFKYLRQQKAYRIFIDLLDPKPGQKLLDVACGPGMLLALAVQNNLKGYGIDISNIAVKMARQKVPDAFTFVANAECLPYNDQVFDFVTCIGSLERMINVHKVLFELIRVSKPTARFVFMTRNSKSASWVWIKQFLGLRNWKGHQSANHLEHWQYLFDSNGLEIVTVLPDQWIMERISDILKKIKLRPNLPKIHKRFVPIEYANEFIFLLKKKGKS